MLTPETFAQIAQCLAENLEPPALGTALAALAPLLQPAREQHEENYARPNTAMCRRAKPKPRVRIRARKADGGIRNKPALSPCERARAALQANPDLSMTKLAEIAKCSRSTVVAVRNAMAAEQKKPDPAPSSRPSETATRLDRATKFLQAFLAGSPRPASDVEAAAERARISEDALHKAREALGLVTARANSGGVMAVTLALPA